MLSGQRQESSRSVAEEVVEIIALPQQQRQELAALEVVVMVAFQQVLLQLLELQIQVVAAVVVVMALRVHFYLVELAAQE
jgi:hypothetical protein